jgi:mono/diheme cytochrome c family protein
MKRFAWLAVPLLALPLLGSLASAVVASGTAAPSSQVAEGQRIYLENCAACHGEDGQRGAAYQTPIWGPRAQIRRFENALGLFEYNQITMPFNEPTQINDVQKLAVVAFILANHGAMAASATLEYAKAADIAVK